MGKRTGGKNGGPYGTRNGAARLDERKVREIRKRYVPYVNASQLAAEYGIDRRTVRAIALGETWGWLQDD